MDLHTFGNLIALDIQVDITRAYHELANYNDLWAPYNPLKRIPRSGLSLVSLNGETDGKMDLNSLLEINRLSGSRLGENDFKMPTPILTHNSELTRALEPFKPFLRRSHILRLDAGGFFPWHRDAYKNSLNSFRLFASLQNSTNENFNFILGDQKLNLEIGRLYYINTRLPHAVFAFEQCDQLILNVEKTEESVNAVLNHMAIK